MRMILPKPFHPVTSAFLVSTVVASLAASAQPAKPAGAETEDAFAECQKLGRGVNVLGYDPIWDARGKGRFQEKDFGIIRSGGFQTLRVNLYPFRHMGSGPNYPLNDAWWHTTDWIVDQADAVKLNVILDFHEYEALGKDAEGNKARFLAFWRQFAPHFKDAPPSVLFEILNEPNGKMTSPVWNQYLAEALAIIRQTNPSRTVVVGPASYNSIDHLEELVLPDQDRHLIVTVHYYKPMDFTHQGAPWAHLQNKIGVVWEGNPQERAAIALDFQKAQDWAQKHSRPIFLGEFGAYDKGDMASRARYTDCVARTAEHFGWSWAYWQFDSDFIVYDISKSDWVEPIYRALIPKGISP